MPCKEGDEVRIGDADFDPQPNPQLILSYTTCAHFGSHRAFVSR
jgi:hypothetical protein